MQDSPLIDPRDLQFQLFELLDAVGLTRRARHAEHSRETFEAALEAAHQIALREFLPHNRLSDEHEPRWDGQQVQVRPEVGRALQAFCDAGFTAAAQDAAEGGMQLPVLLVQACLALFKSANTATTSYVGLTMANANVIARFGTASQQRRYLQPLRAGRFFGTMALTEPQAGSSLSDLRTTAVPLQDGRYAIRGQKVFISGGDHELSDNIVHLVLARIDGAPPGVKGLSLFTVPKWHVHDDGSLGERNDVALAGLIHKTGWRGTTSTMLSFGEQGRCIGELVGAPGQGLACMFHMMNEARIGVGLGATMLGWRGYRASLQYARERRQGRPPAAKDPLQPQQLLIEHADVRRMLLAQKAYVEGAFALGLYCARLVDEQQTGESEAARAEAAALLELLTPVVKSWPAQWCLEANSLAMQVHGGYGYTREYPVEQFWRDNRLNMIHEGTHGIQALDLLGRKIHQHDGAALRLLDRELTATLVPARALADLRQEADALATSWDEVACTVAALRPVLAEDAGRALANAHLFLEAFGHTVIAWTWLRQAVLAARALADGATAADAAFYRGKLQACRWFFRWELPRTRLQHDLLRRLDDSVPAMQPDWF